MAYSKGEKQSELFGVEESAYRVNQMKEFEEERKNMRDSLVKLRCSRSNYEMYKNASNSEVKGPTPSTSNNRSYSSFGYDKDLGLSAEQEGIMSVHQALEMVEQLSENVVKSLSVQEQATVKLEKFKMDMFHAIDEIRSRLDVLEKHVGVGINKAAVAPSNLQSKILFQLSSEATPSDFIAAPNKLVKPAGVPVPAQVLTPSTKDNLEKSSKVPNKLVLSATKENMELSSAEEGKAEKPVSSLLKMRARMQTLVKPKLQASEENEPLVASPSDSVDGHGIVASGTPALGGKDESLLTALKTLNASAGPGFASTNSSIVSFKIGRPRLVKPRPPSPIRFPGPSTCFDDAKSAVSKLCWNKHKFDEISTVILNLVRNLKETEKLKDLVDYIFDTVVQDSSYANSGAKLCQRIYQHPSGGKDFQNLLISRCQTEFTNVLSEIGTNTAMEKRAPGLISFLAELYFYVRKDENSPRNTIMALACIELMRTLLAVRGACQLKANIFCTVEVLKLLKPVLLSEGSSDDGIRVELEKLGAQFKRVESSGASELTAELRKMLSLSSMQIKLLTSKLSKPTRT